MSVSLLALLLGAQVQAHPVAPGSPAVLRPLIERAARCSANPQLVVALTGFTPPRRGAAALVVSLRTADGRTTRLGEVGVFPHRPFSASLAEARRFGFAIPRAALGGNPSVVVEMTGAAAAGGRAVVGEARLTSAPQERCEAP